MMKLTLGQPHNPYTARVGDPETLLSEIYGVLSASEWVLIQLMVTQQKWQGTPPTIGNTTGGNIEYGVFLYLLNNTSDIENSTLRTTVVDFLNDLTSHNLPLPPSSYLTAPNYQGLNSDNLVWEDGSIVGTATYELYDQNWLITLTNLVKTVFEGWLYGGGTLPLPGRGYSPIQATSRTNSSTLIVGLLSDWGTGQPNASRVMSNLTSLSPAPDYLVHLGDVYYSGTPVVMPYAYSRPFEELLNFRNLWPSEYENRSFTLNSNHEMYSGANGYFGDALGVNWLQPQVFDAQDKKSMFALQIGGWTLLALDTAYHSDPLGLFMYGVLDDSQVSWVQGLGLTASKTIVLTHHTGCDYDGTFTSSSSDYSLLWSQLQSALGGSSPYAWYWGHIHNGIVYQNPINSTYCRCLGHGALPFGVATGLTAGQNNIQFFEGESGTAYNGFVTLSFELDGNGDCEQITESYYDIGSGQQPVFNQVLYPSPSA